MLAGRREQTPHHVGNEIAARVELGRLVLGRLQQVHEVEELAPGRVAARRAQLQPRVLEASGCAETVAGDRDVAHACSLPPTQTRRRERAHEDGAGAGV